MGIRPGWLLAGATALAVALAAAAPVEAKVRVKESTSYYSVSGRTGAELGRAMITGGTRATRLNHAVAATGTRFSFKNPRIVVEGGQCVLRDVDVILDITYYMPKWDAADRASASLRGSWKQFYTELVRHEHTHGSIAKKFAGRIEKEMLSLRGNVSVGCRDFGSNAQVRFNKLATQLKGLQAAFDAKEQLSSSRISQLQLRLLKSR